VLRLHGTESMVRFQRRAIKLLASGVTVRCRVRPESAVLVLTFPQQTTFHKLKAGNLLIRSTR
jgi:hypothetical protein